MISSISGQVIEILDKGFRLETAEGSRVAVSTVNEGRRLGLKTGDHVLVSGGPRGDVFASSTVSKRLPDGNFLEVPSNVLPDLYKEEPVKDRHEIVGILGRGDLATVYLANLSWRGKGQVALKVLDLFGKSQVTLERELRAAAILEHPHILPIYEIGMHPDYRARVPTELPYFTMPHARHGSLQDRLRQGLLPPAEAARIVTRVAEALDYAHSRGVVHGDVKPSNILFDVHGEANLSDFTLWETENANAESRAVWRVGSADHISPEQAQWYYDLGQPDPRSDIYSLGVVLFHALSGAVPFKAHTTWLVGQAHRTQPIPSVRVARPQLSPEWDGLFARALAKEPAERFPTAGDLAREASRWAR